MDTTETTDPIVPDYPLPPLVIDQEGKYFLHTAGRWATFLGIMGFIGTGVIALCAIFIGSIFSVISRLNPAAQAIPSGVGGFLTFLYLMIAVFYFFMSYYLYQFGTKIKNGTSLNDSALATKAFMNLKSHFKLIGITTIIFLSIEILAVIIVVIAAVFATSASR